MENFKSSRIPEINPTIAASVPIDIIKAMQPAWGTTERISKERCFKLAELEGDETVSAGSFFGKFPEDPKDDGSRVPAATYAWMIPVVTRVARTHGYAIGVHGSMGRDLDLIAVPWVENPSLPIELIKGIAGVLDGIYGPFTEKSHGRITCNIRFENAWHFLDISIFKPIDCK